MENFTNDDLPRTLDAIYYEISREPKPKVVNKGPFHVFAMIDGHRGDVVAEFVKRHLMNII